MSYYLTEALKAVALEANRAEREAVGQIEIRKNKESRIFEGIWEEVRRLFPAILRDYVRPYDWDYELECMSPGEWGILAFHINAEGFAQICVNIMRTGKARPYDTMIQVYCTHTERSEVIVRYGEDDPIGWEKAIVRAYEMQKEWDDREKPENPDEPPAMNAQNAELRELLERILRYLKKERGIDDKWAIIQ